MDIAVIFGNNLQFNESMLCFATKSRLFRSSTKNVICTFLPTLYNQRLAATFWPPGGFKVVAYWFIGMKHESGLSGPAN